MRAYIKECFKCLHSGNCIVKKNIQISFKEVKNNFLKSISVSCNNFKQIAEVGDIIEFDICGNTIKRPVFYVSKNCKTFLVLTAKNERNKELFTLYSEYSTREKKYYIDDEVPSNYNNNLMLGIVNYKYINKVARKINIPKIKKDNNFSIDWLLIGEKA